MSTRRGAPKALGVAALMVGLSAAAASQTWNYELVHAFRNDETPRAGLTQLPDGTLYGATYFGGSSGLGAIFRLDSSAIVTTIYSFNGVDGAHASAALIQASDGYLYGTTADGGTTPCAGNGCGTVFRIDLLGQLTSLHAFDHTDGWSPSSALVESSDGFFYGVTPFGGSGGCLPQGCGTVFKSDTLGHLTSLYSFVGEHAPSGALIQAADGSLYGTTYFGGSAGWGTIFRWDLSGGLTTVLSFGQDGGWLPSAGLIQATDGDFYGSTYFGGGGNCSIFPVEGCGTIFRVDASGTLKTLHAFTTSGGDGANPSAELVQASDGNLYGTTQHGGSALLYGAVFQMDTSGNLTTLHSFNGLNGAYPSALIQGTDGNLYGTAEDGPTGGGVIFRLTAATFAVNAITPRSGPSAGSTDIDILGGGFQPGAAVAIGGLPATNVTVSDPAIIVASTPTLSPGTLNDVTVTNPGAIQNASATLRKVYFADFLDVPQTDIFHDFVETIFRNGVTAGYGNGYYGRDDSVTRAQMAVLLLKAEHGYTYTPPACSGVFKDVICTPGAGFADWIEQLAVEEITGGCYTDPLRYCPDRGATRAEMAVLLLKTQHGIGYQPPACVGIFADVPCPSTPAFPYSDWIEQLAAESVTDGCGNSNYCPEDLNTRGQIAVFLVKTFNLQ